MYTFCLITAIEILLNGLNIAIGFHLIYSLVQIFGTGTIYCNPINVPF